MKRIVGSIAALALLSTSGCTVILKEVRHPGGYPGYVLDKRTFDASGAKQLQLLRATLILAMAAEMSRVTVTGEDADSFAKHLGKAAAEINFAAIDIYPSAAGQGPCRTTDTGKGGNDCPGFYEGFDGNLPLIEGRLIRVMIAALPADSARRFLNDVNKGNILGAALNALRTIARTAGGLHVGVGRYRSGLEAVAAQMDTKCYASGSLPGDANRFDAATMNVVEAAACLGISQEKLFVSNPPDQRERLRVSVQPTAFHMLMRNVAAACVALPYSGNSTDIAASRAIRLKECNSIKFSPEPRPYELKADGTPIAPVTP